MNTLQFSRGWLLACLSLVFLPVLAEEAPACPNAKDTQHPVVVNTMCGFVTSSAAGKVSASSLLGIGGDAISAIENSQGFVAALKGLGTADGANIGFSVTPGRTNILPMDLQTYAKGFWYRMLGNATLSYAQGTTQLQNVDLQKRAIGLEFSAIIDAQHDPTVSIFLDKINGGGCKWDPSSYPPTTSSENGQQVFDKANKAYVDCIQEKLDNKANSHWNASQLSFSLATGNIRPKDGESTSLGRTYALNLTYGFEHTGIKALKDNAALSLTLRRSDDEPVLESLLTPTVQRRSGTLAALRFSIGTDSFRGLAEVSNARSSDITLTERVYKHAIGFDYRLKDEIWLILRSGKMRKTNGQGDETTTLMDVSYSHKSLL